MANKNNTTKRNPTADTNCSCPYARTVTIGKEKYVKLGGCFCSENMTCDKKEMGKYQKIKVIQTPETECGKVCDKNEFSDRCESCLNTNRFSRDTQYVKVRIFNVKGSHIFLLLFDTKNQQYYYSLSVYAKGHGENADVDTKNQRKAWPSKGPFEGMIGPIANDKDTISKYGQHMLTSGERMYEIKQHLDINTIITWFENKKETGAYSWPVIPLNVCSTYVINALKVGGMKLIDPSVYKDRVNSNNFKDLIISDPDTAFDYIVASDKEYAK